MVNGEVVVGGGWIVRVIDRESEKAMKETFKIMRKSLFDVCFISFYSCNLMYIFMGLYKYIYISPPACLD